MARKRKEITTLTEPQAIENMIEKMASYGLTNKEIAILMNINEATLGRNYDINLTKGKANLREKLKRKQITVALGGNVTMLIWLGKQYLEQTEQIKDSGELRIFLERKELELNERN